MALFLGADFAEPPAQPNDDALDAAVTHQQVRPEPDDRDGHPGSQPGHEISQIVLVGGREQDLRRAADAEPCDVGQREIAGQPPAQVGQPRG